MVITAIQINANNKSEENLDKTLYSMEKALETSPDIIVLPEYTNYMGPPEKSVSNALPESSMWHKKLSGFAKMNKTGLVAGLLVKAGNNKATSSVLYFDKQGICRSTYEKLHLFDIHLDEQVSIRESRYLNPGTGPVIFNIEHIPCGFAICYDLRFPELFRTLTMKNARVIFLPAAFTDITGQAHWEILVRARAIENQVYIIAVNQIGEYADGKRSYGKSMIVDPWGTVLAVAPSVEEGNSEAIISADIDFSLQDAIRKKLPCLSHRRKDIFDNR